MNFPLCKVIFIASIIHLGILSQVTSAADHTALDSIPNFIPTVTVEGQTGDSSVDVLLPNIVDLTTDTLPNRNRADLSVLSGFLTVSSNKTKIQNGLTSVPVTVSIFGIPVYVGNHVKRPDPIALPTTKRPKLSLPTDPVEQKALLMSNPKDRNIGSRLETDRSSNEPSPSPTMTGSIKKSDMAALLTKLAQTIAEQGEIIKELRAERAAARLSASRSSSSSSSRANPFSDTSKIDLEKVADILRNRRQEID